MLVLSRKRLESVVVGGAVDFERLLKVAGTRAPRRETCNSASEVDPSVPVHREEIWQRIHGPGKPDSPLQDPLAPMD